MSKKKTFKVKAGKNAPDVVSHGNFNADKIGGAYETDDERFAGFLERTYGTGSPADQEPAKPADRAGADPQAEGGTE